MLSELVHDLLGQLAGDGQAHALRAAGGTFDGGGDADHLAMHVDERTAAVAWIDGGIRLQEVATGRWTASCGSCR